MRSLAASLAALFLLAGCGGGGGEDAETPDTALRSSYDECAGTVGDPDDPILAIDDDGEGVVITTPEPGGDGAALLAFSAASCLLDASDAPSTIFANMQTTTAMMGRQSASYDDIEVQWSYSAGEDSTGFQATFQQTD